MISFNRWVTDASYRRALALSLGLPFDDSAANRVAPCAGGSSFQGTRYDWRATQMPVLERWREVSDRPEYRRLFTPPLLELAAEVFGTVVTDRQAQAA